MSVKEDSWQDWNWDEGWKDWSGKDWDGSWDSEGSKPVHPVRFKRKAELEAEKEKAAAAKREAHVNGIESETNAKDTSATITAQKSSDVPQAKARPKRANTPTSGHVPKAEAVAEPIAVPSKEKASTPTNTYKKQAPTWPPSKELIVFRHKEDRDRAEREQARMAKEDILGAALQSFSVFM